MTGARLLDANVLVALAWPNHAMHEAAHRWMSGVDEWASTASTECAFLRLSLNPAVVGHALDVHDVLAALRALTAHSDHERWPEDESPAAAPLMGRCTGHRQVTDAWLLSVAAARGGRLATFDRRLAVLCRDEPQLVELIER